MGQTTFNLQELTRSNESPQGRADCRFRVQDKLEGAKTFRWKTEGNCQKLGVLMGWALARTGPNIGLWTRSFPYFPA